MAGKAPREKGNRLERLIVAILTAAGLDAKRVPLSGSMRGFKGDVVCTILGQPLKIEAKSRRKGFEFIYNALGQNDCLVIKTDRSDPLIIMPLRRLANLTGAQCENVPSVEPLTVEPTPTAKPVTPKVCENGEKADHLQA